MCQYSGTLPRMSEQSAMGRDTGWVSTEVWQEIAPSADVIAPGERKLLRRSAIGIAAVVALAVAGWWSGLLVPRVGAGNSAGGQADMTSRAVTYETTLVNRGLVPVTVGSVTVDAPGLGEVATDPSPVRIGPGASAPVRLELTVTDCAKALPAIRITQEGPRVDLEVRRLWGTAGARLDDNVSSGVRDLVYMACGVDSGA